MRYLILSILSMMVLVPSSAEACGMYLDRQLLVDSEIAPTTPEQKTEATVVVEKNPDAKAATTSVNLRNAFAEIDAIDVSPEALSTGVKQKSQP